MDEMDPALDSLLDMYKSARILLIELLLGNAGVGTKTYYNTILLQLTALLDELRQATTAYIASEIPKAYQTALDQLYEDFSKTGLQMKRPDAFAQIHDDAIYDMCREMQHHVDDGLSQAGRRVMRYADKSKDEALRQAGLKTTAKKAATGSTVQDMQADLMSELSKDGFMGVQYGEGDGAYQVPLETYTAMVARSTTREAGNLARENQLRESGYDLMQMTTHYPTCHVCAALQGRVYSISGKDPRFPPLSKAFPSGYRNVHPNCRHVMTYYIEEMQEPEDLAKDIAFSNRPFEDTRSDKEKALYSKQQAEARRMREDRHQYERFKQRLGSDAPKSFSAFRKTKNQNGDRWKELQRQYRKAGRENAKTIASVNPKQTDAKITKLRDSAPIVHEKTVDKSVESGIMKMKFESDEATRIHFEKHQNEFGNITEDDYVDLANNLANAQVSEDVEQLTRSDGSVSKYRISSNDFVVVTKEGNIRTFFKPNLGKEYWDYEHERN